MNVTVIIPTYNRANLLPKAVESVLNQTIQPLEILIVDDHSTDNTKEVVESFKNEKIKYIVNSREKGANGARNTGIVLAKGDYIAFQDSDDIWKPKKLEKQVQYCTERPEVDMVFCSLSIENLNRIVPKRKVESNEIKALLERGNFISTQTIFIKKEVAEKTLFDESLMRFQDWDFCIRVSRNYLIHHLNEVLAIADVQNDSISKKINQIEALKQFFNKYPELKESNMITKSFVNRILSANESNSKMRSKVYSFKAFSYEFFDKVFNRRNRL
ncbi:glycosyltransferase family 2 protein [Robertmurraya sp. P23]|uniref:glycosyltransferase family 2 protein n=1 Tax=Robertmurraya sp. P23 TaxID=3436931 RepID=UPI003D999240